MIGPDGRPVCVEEAATGAAELMIEAPGHVVARAADAAKERRVRAMAADERSAPARCLLVPASRAGARLGDREVEAIGRLIVSGGGRKKGRSKQPGGKRIFPEVVVDMSAAEEDEMGTQVQAQAQAHCRRSTQWRPALDTIYEA